MKIATLTKLTCGLAVVVCGAFALNADNSKIAKSAVVVQQLENQAANDEIITDENIMLCQGLETGCNGSCNGGCSTCAASSGFGYGRAAQNPTRMLNGVDQNTPGRNGGEPSWDQASPIPWEAFAYGEYIGPHRTPHVGEYKIRVNDQLELVYMLTREKSIEPYQIYVGDVIQISSAIDSSLNQTDIGVLPDGTVSLPLIGQVRVAGKTVGDLQREMNDKYTKFVKNPSIVVQVSSSETPLQDLRDAVDARAGQGGQARLATVSPDGTIQLPLIGSVPAVGLTLSEIGREINARYNQQLHGIRITPVLLQPAPRFIYVLGEVGAPGRFELEGPTSAIQAVALAEGFLEGGNIRQIVVFRRDQNWRLTATLLDLGGALLGKRPRPSDEIWLRDSDIVLIPKKPIQRFSEAVNQYFTESLYGIFPNQIGSFDAGGIFVN